MGISGRSETFNKGILDNADVKFSNSRWEMKESKAKPGTENPFLMTDFIDVDGTEHEARFIALGGAGRGTRLAVIEGKLVTVGEEDGEAVDGGAFSAQSAVAKLLASLEDLGFSPKKLDKVSDDAGVFDDQWVHVEQKPSGRTNPTTGKDYTDLIVTALLDESEVEAGAKKGKKASTASTVKKGKAAPVADDDDEEEEAPASSKGKGGKAKLKAAPEPEEEEEEADETEAEAEAELEDDPAANEARAAVVEILSDPASYVKNYNPKKNDGKLTIKEVYNASFSMLKGKNKAAATGHIMTAEFHTENSEAGLYDFDDENGLLSAAAPKKKTTKK